MARARQLGRAVCLAIPLPMSPLLPLRGGGSFPAEHSLAAPSVILDYILTRQAVESPGLKSRTSPKLG